jgi:hypothetical protein
MDEMLWLRMFGGGFGSGVDVAAVLAFVAFGIVSFLTPVLGYRPARSGGITASLYLLVGYVGMSIVQLLLFWSQYVNEMERSSSREETGILMILLFPMLKMVLFLVAMLCFAIGVTNLRLSSSPPDA